MPQCLAVHDRVTNLGMMMNWKITAMPKTMMNAVRCCLFLALTMLTSERPIGFSTHQGKQQRIPMEQPKISPHRTQIQKQIEERFLSIESKTE